MQAHTLSECANSCGLFGNPECRAARLMQAGLRVLAVLLHAGALIKGSLPAPPNGLQGGGIPAAQPVGALAAVGQQCRDAV